VKHRHFSIGSSIKKYIIVVSLLFISWGIKLLQTGKFRVCVCVCEREGVCVCEREIVRES